MSGRRNNVVKYVGGEVKVVDACHLFSHLSYERKQIITLFIEAVENK